MLIKNYTHIMYLLSFLLFILLSNKAIAQGLTEEEIAKMTKEEKNAKLEQLKKEKKEVKTELKELDEKYNKLKDHYIEIKYIKIERKGKTYKESIVTFIKKDEILKKAEELMENSKYVEADYMMKKYRKTNEQYSVIWWNRRIERMKKAAELGTEIYILTKSLEEEEPKEKLKPSINISGSWKYAGERGTAEIKQSGKDVTMILSVKPRKGKDHYTITAKLNGYTLEGAWEFTATVEDYDPENFTKSDCKNGRFFAEVNADVSTIKVLSSTEDKCSPGHGWHLVVFTKK